MEAGLDDLRATMEAHKKGPGWSSMLNPFKGVGKDNGQ
jgi:hypothetical protein